MNYLSLINSFWDSATTNPLSTGQVSLYFALLHVCNRSNWTEWFSAPNQVLSVLTGLSRSGILKARNELKQRGLIDFRERGTKATSYKLITANNNRTDILMANSKQVSMQDSMQDGVQNSTQNGVQIGNTLKDIDINKDRKRDIPLTPLRRTDSSPVEHFEEFCEAYPKKGFGRPGAEYAYCRVLMGDCHITEKDLVAAAANYAEAVRLLGRTEQYIRSPESFLTDNFFASYLPGQYERPKAGAKKEQKKNSFNQFEQNSYDFAALEDELVSN